MPAAPRRKTIGSVFPTGARRYAVTALKPSIAQRLQRPHAQVVKSVRQFKFIVSWLAAAFLAACVPAHALTNKVLIIGIDGTMCSALAVAKTPNIDALKSNGCYSVRAITHPVTHSAACWSSMFTGVWGDKHLVNDPGNSFTGNNFAAYPSFFKRLEGFNPNLNTLCFARWAPLVTVVPDADEKLSFSTDADIAAETCRRLTNSNPDVFYMILLDVDSAGHTYGWGPAVTNYVKAIETADARVGQIIDALHKRATYTNEDWLVICLTDHGEHDNPDPEKSRITWHIFSGPSAARGILWPSPAIVDVCATVLTHMGVPINPAWNLDARVEGLPLSEPGYGRNLIFNGDAEANSGTGVYATNRGIAWWFDIASTTLGTYGSNVAFPTLVSSGPEARGRNFFLGGTTNGSISQRIDLSAVGDDIDYPGVSYQLAGFFGGSGAEQDSASLTANFLGTGGAILGGDRIGDVRASERTNITGLLQRGSAGRLPAGTRFVEFVLTNTGVTGNNDGSADNLSFVLTPNPEPEFRLSIEPGVSGGWQLNVTPTVTNRVYVLERSLDLSQWREISGSVAGTGESLVVSDTNTAGGPVFYRMSCRKP